MFPKGSRKISPEELEEGIEKYLRSISYVRPVRDPETGEQIIGMDRKPLMEIRCAVVPGMYALADYLGITPACLDALARDEGYKDIVDRFRTFLEDWNRRELLTRSGKDVRGVEFNLACNYGWTQTQHVEITGGVEDFLRQKQGSGSDF